MFAYSPVVAAALLCTCAVLPPGGANKASFVRFPGGVADSAGKVAYVQVPSGGVAAIDLASGKDRWTAPDVCRPLALRGKVLVCQAQENGKPNAVRLLFLDTQDKGKVIRTSDLIQFPEWVSVTTTYGRSFASRATLDGDDHLLLHWQAAAFYAGGAPPPPQVVAAARKNASGVARVNLESGKVALLPAAGADKTARVELPKELAGKATGQVWTGTDWRTEPLVVGGKAVAFRKQNAGQQETLYLLSWDAATSKGVAEKELLQGKSVWPMLGLNKHHLFVYQGVPQEQLPAEERGWTVFSLADGKRLARVPLATTPQEITVAGKRLYYVVGVQRFGPPGKMNSTRALQAVDLASGQSLWQHPLWAAPLLPPLP